MAYDLRLMSDKPYATTDLIREITACAARLVSRGWDEATGGNLSVTCPACPADWTTAVNMPAGLAPASETPSLLATTSGKHWRTLATAPESRLTFFSCNPPHGCCHHSAAGMRPTLELRIHLAIQHTLHELGWKSCAVLHVHPPALLTLSTLPVEISAPALAALPWLFPEGGMLLGETVPLIPYSPPGSPELAAATASTLAKSPLAVWQNHGVIAGASNLNATLDVIETAELAAEVFLRCRQAGSTPRLLTPAGTAPPPAGTTH